mgnify:CR=1 FL=1
MRYNVVKNADNIIKDSDYAIKNPEKYKNKWNQIFGNNNPICLELGMGRGAFIIEMALNNPKVNYIGLELGKSQTATALSKIGNRKIKNLRIICADANNIVDYFGKEIDTIYLTFSEPWPKKQDEKKRFSSVNYLKLYDRIFKKNKHIIMKTDNLGLFEYSLESIKEHNKFKLVEYTFDYEFDGSKDGMSEYERKFRELGTKINRLVCIKE